MNKFQRAKKQTIKKWKNILWSWIDEKMKLADKCGFCQEYNTCKNCPVYAIFGDNCMNDVMVELDINPNGYGAYLFFLGKKKEKEIDRQISLAMAILIYLEQMKK